jgi:hypothetical protein
MKTEENHCHAERREHGYYRWEAETVRQVKSLVEVTGDSSGGEDHLLVAGTIRRTWGRKNDGT